MIPILLLAIENEDDRDFIADLYMKYYPIMKKKAYEVSGDYSIVDDIINDSFIKLIKKIGVLKSLDSYKSISYVVYTVKNTSIDYIKHQSVKNKVVFLGQDEDFIEMVCDSEHTPEELLINKERYKDLAEAIDSLSERDRNLLYSKYILELSDKEISKLMNIPQNNIRQYLVRARQRALKNMKKEGYSYD